MEFTGQILSMVAMTTIILSFQCKSNKKLIAAMTVGAFLFATSYFLLGSYVSAVLNLLSLGANLMCLKESLKTKLSFGAILVVFATATFFTFESWWSVVLMVAQLSGIFAMMFGNGKTIRNVRFFFVSPIWLINNIFMVFSLGGMLCEIFTMASVVVSFIRFRKTGFEK